MPTTLTYPGVYIEEVPSGVRTIASVSTADTAFVDCFTRGPMNQAVRITSLADFQRVFGGVDPTSEASYAIQQYFLNGGNVAWVVRVSRDPQPAAATLNLRGGSPLQNTLTVQAANPGIWGNALQVAAVPGSTSDRFNLVVREVVMANGAPVLGSSGLPQVVSSETHRNLSMDQTNARYAVTAVNADSLFIQLADRGLGNLPVTTALTPRGDVPETAFQKLTGATDTQPPDSAALRGNPDSRTGMYALDRIEPFIFNILCLPAAANLDAPSGNLDTPNLRAVAAEAEAYCEAKRAFLIVDVPSFVNTQLEMNTWMTTNDGIRHENAAVYFPRLVIPDPANEGRARDVAASGTLAGVFARTDAARGVWKAPAGTDATLRNANLALTLTDPENGALNPLGINALRNFAIFGNISWGARTLVGADQQASEWKYVPVRRTALYIETSLYQGLKWVVFEPNDEPLWAQIRLNVGAFMHNLFVQSAFQGKTPAEAYFVKCDKETTTQNDIDRGIVNILVGFAPLKPAEFVIIKLAQMAGQVQAGVNRQEGTTDVAQFTVNAQRFDPYKNFKFRVRWDGRYVAGISKVSALKRTTEVVKHREGGDPSSSRKSPGRTEFDPITLERGVTHDTEFEKWANKVWNFGSGVETSLRDFRKDITIDVYNEAGQLAISYHVFRCWVSEYQSLPDLDANANAVAIQHIKLENEGIERDLAVTEPTEPTFTEPAA